MLTSKIVHMTQENKSLSGLTSKIFGCAFHLRLFLALRSHKYLKISANIEQSDCSVIIVYLTYVFLFVYLRRRAPVRLSSLWAGTFSSTWHLLKLFAVHFDAQHLVDSLWQLANAFQHLRLFDTMADVSMSMSSAPQLPALNYSPTLPRKMQIVRQPKL